MSIETKLYDKIKKPMPLPCVGLLVTHKGSLLLTLRNDERLIQPYLPYQEPLRQLNGATRAQRLTLNRVKNLQTKPLTTQITHDHIREIVHSQNNRVNATIPETPQRISR